MAIMSPSIAIAAAAATITDIKNTMGMFFPGMEFTGADVSIFTGAVTGIPPFINTWKMPFIAGQFKRSIYIFPSEE
jgi:hypothetical protein